MIKQTEVHEYLLRRLRISVPDGPFDEVCRVVCDLLNRALRLQIARDRKVIDRKRQKFFAEVTEPKGN